MQTLIGMKYYLLNVTKGLTTLPILAKIAAVLLAVMTPYLEIIYLLIAFIGIDLITGIWKSYKVAIREYKESLTCKSKLTIFWHNFQSKKLRYTIEKLTVYFLLILLIALFENYFLPVTVVGYTLTKLVISLMSLVELRSICENCGIITNNPVIMKIFNLLKKKVSEQINIETPNEEKPTV